MFGAESVPTIVYAYGCKAPHSGGDYAAEQISLAHRYRNALVELERDRRQRVADAMRRHYPDLLRIEAEAEKLDQQVQSLTAQAKAANAQSRSRKASAEMRQAIRDAKAARKECWARHKAMRAEAYADPVVKAELKEIDEWANSQQKVLRAECGVYWGTYLGIEAAARQSRSSKAPPAFQRWTGDGKIGVQLQGGLSIDEAMACEDSRLRIQMLNDHPKKPHAMVSVRIGTNGRDPVWATVLARIHRPLPSGGRIKWVHLVRRRVASTDHWSVQFTVSRTAGFDKPDRATDGKVGINLGWRKVADGIRVATWLGSDGLAGELVLPDAEVSRWVRAETLRSTRDRNFNQARESLRRWMAGKSLPDWMSERTQSLHQWRSCNRLAGLVLFWRDNRFDGDADIYAELEAWRKQDKHLWLWEMHQRRNAARWRDDLYRKFAASMRRRYAECLIDDSDYRRLSRMPGVESDDPVIAAARYNQRIASPGRLAAILRESGPRVTAIDPKDLTRTCHACGHVEGFDAIKELTRACPACGVVWDQDENAAANLLARGDVVSQTREPCEV